MEKKCNKCNVVKDVSEFNKAKENKDGLRGECRICRKEKVSDNNKKYREANKDRISDLQKQWREDNREKIKQHREANKYEAQQYREANRDKAKQYRETNKEKLKDYREANKKKLKLASEKYYEVNIEKIREYNKKYAKVNRGDLQKNENERLETDSLFKLKKTTRNAVKRYLEGTKSKRTKEIIGIDYKEFQDYLKVEYTEGMHLDHIIPLSWSINYEEIYTLNHYSNFQIITAEENLTKSDRYCKSENLKKVLDNHNDLTMLNKIIERNSDKIK